MALCVLAGCAALGGVSDGSSLARGYVNGGVLERGLRLPKKGDGYLIPALWQKRGNNFGTEELVGVIVRAARRVSFEHPGAVLYVADLSPERGGRTQWHKSHQNGRDVDLLFFARTGDGSDAPLPSGMTRFGADGKALGGKDLVLDLERNWALVRALLEDPAVDVQYIFVYSPIRQLLIDHARAAGEDKALVDRAEAIMTQPAEALPHDDHFHVRIYCPRNDVALGCRDRGPLRWFKKTYKYLQERRIVAEVPAPVMSQISRPFCHLASASVFAGL
jgi:penicillin-insensitive murein endopeptidase